MRRRQSGVVRRAQDAAGALQVVVDEPCARESRQHLAAEHAELVVVEGAPARQRELERVEAALHRALDPLDQDPGREADQADHRLRVRACHLLAEEPADLIELALGDGVALAGRPEDVQVPDSRPQVEADLLAEHVLQDLAPFSAHGMQTLARTTRGKRGSAGLVLGAMNCPPDVAGPHRWPARLSCVSPPLAWKSAETRRASTRLGCRLRGAAATFAAVFAVPPPTFAAARGAAAGPLPKAHRIAQPLHEVRRKRCPNEDRELVFRATLEDDVDAGEQRLGAGADPERPGMKVDRTAMVEDLGCPGTGQTKDRPMGGHVDNGPARSTNRRSDRSLRDGPSAATGALRAAGPSALSRLAVDGCRRDGPGRGGSGSHRRPHDQPLVRPKPDRPNVPSRFDPVRGRRDRNAERGDSRRQAGRLRHESQQRAGS